MMDYIRERRLEVAREAMICDGLTIAQAAFKAGYKSAANFPLLLNASMESRRRA